MTTLQQPDDRLAGFNFDQHNAEVVEVWKALRAHQPTRIPIILGSNTRYFMFDPAANPEHIEFRSYSEDPEVMFDCQLRFQRWSRFNLLQDQELGPPKQWSICPDFQNIYEAAWFGCPVEYINGQVPDTHPVFADNPERVMAHGLPDPFGGLFARVKAYYENFKDRAARETFLGLPIQVNPPGLGSDGPLTVACNLFGPDFVCEAMIAEPERLQRLLTFITDANIARLQAWRKYAGLPLKQEGFGIADDSIALISTPMYRQHVMPHHRRLFEAMDGGGVRGTHLCGDSSRHFLTLRDELNIRWFDTGFPVNFAKFRRDLGEDVAIQGGPHVEFLMTASPDEVRQEVKRILSSGVLQGGMMVLREGNNLPPGTPVANTEAMYHAGREFGRIRCMN